MLSCASILQALCFLLFCSQMNIKTPYLLHLSHRLFFFFAFFFFSLLILSLSVSGRSECSGTECISGDECIAGKRCFREIHLLSFFCCEWGVEITMEMK